MEIVTLSIILKVRAVMTADTRRLHNCNKFGINKYDIKNIFNVARRYFGSYGCQWCLQHHKVQLSLQAIQHHEPDLDVSQNMLRIGIKNMHWQHCTVISNGHMGQPLTTCFKLPPLWWFDGNIDCKQGDTTGWVVELFYIRFGHGRAVSTWKTVGGICEESPVTGSWIVVNSKRVMRLALEKQ